MSVVRTSIQYLAPTTSASVLNGCGIVPIGTVVAWIPGYFNATGNSGYNRTLGSTDDIAGANAYLSTIGWRVCDGGEPNDTVSPIWNNVGKKVPQLNDRRFLQGSSFISLAAGSSSDPIDTLNPVGTVQGSINTMPDHKHALIGAGVDASVTSVNISHSHGVNAVAGTLTNANEGSHTHAATGLTMLGAGTHSHSWPPKQPGVYEGNWSTGNASSVAVSGGYGDGSQNTYSDGNAGITAWGSGSYAARASGGMDSNASHTHRISLNTDSTFTGNNLNYPSTASTTSAFNSTGNYGYATGGGNDGNAWYTNTDHTHQYYLPSHRHWIMSRATADNPADHSHTMQGSTAAGSSHTHIISGSVDASTGTGQTQHTHALSGNAGTGSTPTITENRPQYLRCYMIIRIK
jgi:hypothetical protein